MASSASGQDEPNQALWLATRAGKMEPSYPLGTTRCIPQAKFLQKPYNKSFIDQVCLVKMAEYWPCSFFASLWTSTSSRSINMQKKNLANIQPSWPHTWSITHTYCNLFYLQAKCNAWGVCPCCLRKKPSRRTVLLCMGRRWTHVNTERVLWRFARYTCNLLRRYLYLFSLSSNVH